MTEQKTEKMTEEKKAFEVVETTFDNLEFEEDQNSAVYDQVYFVKPKTKDLAYFEFSMKVGDKIHKDSRTSIHTIDGKVTKLELSSYTYEQKEVKTFRMNITKEINGKSCLFMLSSSYTQTGRSLLNSLLGCDKPIDKINITLYKNHAGYASIKVSINGKKAMWRYDISEQRKKIETIKNKRGEFVSNDYTDLDNMFEEKIREHLGVLFPEMDHIKFIPEADVTSILDTSLKEPKDEATFGSKDDDESDFFNLDSED